VAFHVRFEAASAADFGAPDKDWASAVSDANMKKLMSK
jgi:hypothetical protein